MDANKNLFSGFSGIILAAGIAGAVFLSGVVFYQEKTSSEKYSTLKAQVEQRANNGEPSISGKFVESKKIGSNCNAVTFGVIGGCIHTPSTITFSDGSEKTTINFPSKYDRLLYKQRNASLSYKEILGGGVVWSCFNIQEGGSYLCWPQETGTE